MKTLYQGFCLLVKALTKGIIAMLLAVQLFATVTGPDNVRHACDALFERLQPGVCRSIFDIKAKGP